MANELATDDSKFEINRQLKRTAKDSLVYLPTKVIPAIIGIILIRIFTSIFTPEEYGYYQITLSTFGLISLFSSIWLSTSVTRFYLNHKNKNLQSTFFSTLFLCTLTATLIIALISYLINLYIFKDIINSSLYSLINLAIIASIFHAFFEIFIVVFRAGFKTKKFALFWTLFAVGKPLLGVLFIILFGFRVDGIFLGFIVVPFVLNIFIFFKLNLNKYLNFKLASKSLFKQFAKFGIPLSFSFFSFWLLSFSDRYLIEIFQGTGDVGLYSVGYIISEKMLNFIYVILLLAAYPIIIDNWEKYGDERTQQLITELTRYFLIICVPILVILVVIPKEILMIFSSEKFIKGAQVLPFIAIGIFFKGLTHYVQKGFELHKKSIRIAGIALFAGFMNISLNLVLIPRFGVLGAGFSACCAYIIYFLLTVYFVRNVMRWQPPYKSIINILIAAFTFGSFLKIISNLTENILLFIFFLIPFGIIIFFITLFLLNEIKKKEVQQAWNFIQGFF